MMKTKLSLLAFLLLPTISFSVVTYPPECSVTGDLDTLDNLETFSKNDVQYGKSYESSNYVNGTVIPTVHKYKSFLRCTDNYNIVPCTDSSYYQFYYDVYKNPVVSCPLSLSNYNNDPTGCSNAGGYYLADGTCVSGSDAIARIFNDPLAVSGVFLFLNGFAWTAAGALAMPVSGGASGAAIGYGIHAMAIGLGMIAFSDGVIDFSSVPVSPSNDSMSGNDRIKIDLVNLDGNPDVLAMTVADTSTGKVSDVSTIPADVRQRILDGNVNPTTGEAYNITPMDLSGTKTTHYDYSTNTATTSTVNSDGSISTQSTPITTVSNSDGSVTTSALDSSIAPTVTGTTSPSGSSTSWTPVASSGSSGGTTGTTNTGGGSSGGTSSGTNENGDDLYEGLTLDDGSSQFGSLTDIVTSSYSTFTGGDSVEITCSNTLSFDPIYFDLKGRRYTLFSVDMLNYIPVDIFRSILLFAAAVTGLLITFSGGM